jgi:UDP-galactopyranose mutase
VWTGPVDEHFDHCFGRLPYRSLEFELRNAPTPDGGLLQPVGVVNEPSPDVPYTRTSEYRHLTGQTHTSSSYHVEYPRAEGDPYYPVPTEENRTLYHRYEELAASRSDVTFVGRLARYQYLNMDQVVGQALATYNKLAQRLTEAGRTAA